MKLLRLFITFFLGQNVVKGDEISSILDKDEILRTRMSTKTIYPEPLDIKEENHECTPIQLNYVIRHGTRSIIANGGSNRFPTIKDITRISNLQKKLVQELLSTSKSNTSTKKIKKKQEALGWLKDWKIPYPNEKAGWLANAGVHELMKMGRRLRQHFFRQQTHHHYDHYYHSDKYIFEHTWKIRTKQSAFAFANGFFDGHQFVNYQTDPIGKDEELRFFDNCPAFHQQIDTNQTAIRQYQLYRDSLQMNKNLKKFMTYTRVDTRGNHSIKLTQKDLEAAYAACAFDIALQESNTRNWCRFFDQEMLLSMDFYQDLKHFYKKSHGDGTTGHLLAWEIASPLLQDFFTSMKQKILGQSTIQAHFRFAHAETILPFVTLLNLTQFDPDQHTILHANFTIKELLERKFHSSFLSPFAANIGFVLYQCPSLSKKEQKEHFVKLFLNEKEVQMKDCHKNLCRFEFLEKKFQKWLQEYNFQQSCSTIN